MKDGTVYINLEARVEKLEAALKTVNHRIEESARRSETANERIKNSILKIGVAYLSLRSATQFIKQSIDLSILQAQAELKVEQALKQTGQAAGFSANQLKKAASELQNITGIGDEKILNDVSLQLLTFGNISGESFTRAQKAALDLSAVLGSDLRSQTIQLGKALDNPKEGLTALRRAGIMFSDTQEAQIKKLVDQNKLFDAQKLILDEIESKYGGQAEAMNKASNGVMTASAAWGDLKEQIGNLFGPLLSKWLPQATKGVQGWIVLLNKLRGIQPEIGGAEERRAAYIETLKGSTKEYRDELIKTTQAEKRRYETDLANFEEYKKNKVLEDFENGKTTDITELDNQKRVLEIQKQQAAERIKWIKEYKDEAEKTSKVVQKTKTTIGDLEKEISDLREDIKNTDINDKNGLAKLRTTLAVKEKLLKEYNGEETKELDKIQKEKIKILDEYYTAVGFLDSGYYAWKKNKILEDFAAKQKAVGNEIELQKQLNAELSKLEEEKNSYFKTPEIIDTSTSRYEEAESLNDMSENLANEFTDAEIARYDKAKEIDNELQQNRLNAVAELGNELEYAFGRSGDSLIRSLNQGFQIALKIAKTIEKSSSGESDSTTDILGYVGDALSIAGLFFGAHNGGEFYGGPNGKPIKLSRGASFTVPEGFNNDRFGPFYFESGERINVTPSHQANSEKFETSKTNALLQKMVGYYRASLLNERSADIKIKAAVEGVLSGNDIYLSTKYSQKDEERYR